MSGVSDAIAVGVSHLKLDSSSGGGRPIPARSAQELATFSPNTSSLLQESLVEDQKEASMRSCFSEVFDREVEYLQSLNVSLTKERKRQILADILVWAEVTQKHYDTSTRSFVLEPNQNDESFIRVGQFLREAMQQRGIMA